MGKVSNQLLAVNTAMEFSNTLTPSAFPPANNRGKFHLFHISAIGGMVNCFNFNHSEVERWYCF